MAEIQQSVEELDQYEHRVRTTLEKWGIDHSLIPAEQVRFWGTLCDDEFSAWLIDGERYGELFIMADHEYLNLRHGEISVADTWVTGWCWERNPNDYVQRADLMPQEWQEKQSA
jgi:hypothetical protein